MIDEVFEIEKGGKTSYDIHPYEHEVLILEGTGILKSDKREEKVKPYDAIYIAPDEPHQFVNDGDETLKIICVIPKGKEDHLK
ncbi:cupin domain-containing protein [Candidatus Aerophobetes bacterium]|nr:cupin domain-containing protein [Candidatus Aerophobetes bacterium]